MAIYRKIAIHFVILSVLLITLFLILLYPGASYCNEAVKVCSDIEEWPPYLYYERVNGKPDKSKLTGASAEFIRAVFSDMNIKYTIKLLPWQRCLFEVETFGSTGEYEVFVDGSYNERRYSDFYISAPIYKTLVGAFYSRKRFPDGPRITKASDLNNYKLIGIKGYNYEPYISAGVTTTIDRSGKNNSIVFRLLEKQRFDFFLSSVESVYGSHAIGQHIIPDEITNIIVPGTKKYTFYLFVAKTSPRAYELYTKINQSIIRLQETGVSDKIFKKFVQGGSGL